MSESIWPTIHAERNALAASGRKSALADLSGPGVQVRQGRARA